ncbi:MAG: cobaltochelatase subunit CobN [Alsobacter sp.]
MHLLRTQTQSLDEAAQAVDLEQSAADIVFLSFTDSDLALVAAAWEQAAGDPAARFPSLRLANLAQLRHPYSVDLQVERLAGRAKVVLVRLLGGLDYWRYGVEEWAAAARRHGFALAVVPGDHQEDPRLDAASTLPVEDLRRLWAWFQHGGPANAASCLGWIAARAGLARDWREPEAVPAFSRFAPGEHAQPAGAPRALVVFYRSVLMAADTAPLVALGDALAGRGFAVACAAVTSLKDPAAAEGLADLIAGHAPDVVLNTTAFSGRTGDGPGVLDGADCPVLQVILAGSSREAWAGSDRGLGAADLAMNVVLPEGDGRLVTRAISFKAEAERHAELEFSRHAHVPDLSRIAWVADLAAAWARLRRTPRTERRIACVLSDYPHKGGRAGYAVGLDTAASVDAMLGILQAAGYRVPAGVSAQGLMHALTGGGAPPAADPAPRGRGDRVASEPMMTTAAWDGAARSAAGAATSSGQASPAPPPLPLAGRDEERGSGNLDAETVSIPLATYRGWLANLPAAFQASITTQWGDPGSDPAVAGGAFRFPVIRLGSLVVALQPERGRAEARKGDYHDTGLPPRHAYVAFYAWLREQERVHAVVHLGAHGTLEWLPGKAVALDEACAPEAVLGPVPVLYPFIVNNPGEAAQAKRRLAAVTLGHLTPPLAEAGQHGVAAELEALFDEYADAQALDPRRARLLASAILDKARESGLLEEAGLSAAGDAETVLQGLDAWLCDLKEMRIGDGLHVFGRPVDPARRDATAAAIAGASGADAASVRMRLEACAPAEAAALLAGLDGRFVPPGPAGAPSRGRIDVLPTGRNLATVDPRAVPTRTAWEIGRRTAEEVVARYAQDHGDWPRAIVVDLWGSATMRTGGDDLAQALALLGVRPTWDAGSARVSGFEILPPAHWGRPRVDVTLRISGLFRDVFPTQVALFDEAVRAVAALDEDEADNPLAAAAGRGETLRVFGAAPGRYGIGLGHRLQNGGWESRDDLGEAYLAAAGWAYGAKHEGQAAPEAFRSRVAAADAFVHVQDMAEQDVLDSDAFAEHEGGFAAAAATLGAHPALYHPDTTAGAPKVRTLSETIARTLRGRAANPRWIAGQMRHGHRGAAEIAESVDNLFAFAATTDAVPSRHFDLMFDATCGNDEVRRFLMDANPQAAGAVARRFEEAARRGFWTTRRNSCAATLRDMLETLG